MLKGHPGEGHRWAPRREKQFGLTVLEEPMTHHGNKGRPVGGLGGYNNQKMNERRKEIK